MSRILLLEPNRLLSKQYREYLKNQGYNVVCCEDAQEGINAADSSKPDLVIVELLLAGHSGIEFLYEFRSYSEWRDIPAIILSSVAENEAALPEGSREELGITTFLYKPQTSLDKLGRKVSRSLTPATK